MGGRKHFVWTGFVWRYSARHLLLSFPVSHDRANCNHTVHLPQTSHIHQRDISTFYQQHTGHITLNSELKILCT